MRTLLKGWRRRLAVILLAVALILAGVVVTLLRGDNRLYKSLDALSKISFGDRWAHPEMLKIRALGPKAMPDLRRVLREKESPRTRFLLWTGSKWPGVTKFVRNFPEPARLNDRRGTACQVIHNLGAAGKSAAPELVRIFKTGDNEDWNSASMALNAVGIDAEIAKQLVQLVESGVPDNAKPQIFWMLEKVTPPSARAVKILGEGLESHSVWVQQSAAQVIGRMKAVTPPIAAKLREIQGTTDDLPLFISVTSALWLVEKNKDLTFSAVTKRLESEMQNYQRPQWPGNGGQAVDSSDQAFISAANLLVLMELGKEERAKVVDLLERFTLRTERIFVAMLLLPDMLKLGYPAEKGLEVCRRGLGYTEDYYRLQAARLLSEIAERNEVKEDDLRAMIRDREIGVRVYGARAFWLRKSNATDVIPILVDALNREKYQSYYYPEIQSAALDLLGRIGPENKTAIQDLEKLKNDPDPAIAKAAAEVLKNIEK